MVNAMGMTILRDRSLITGRGATQWVWRVTGFNPTKKRTENGLAMLKGGGERGVTKGLEVVWGLEF